MSSQDIVFNGSTFVQNVERYATGSDPIVKTQTLDTSDVLNVLNTATGSADTFLESFNQANKPFSTWSDFLQAASGGDSTKEQNILNSFVTAYRTITGMGSGGPDDPPAADWTDLVQGLADQTPPVTINAGQQFIHSFENFLFNYPYNGNGGVTDASEFFKNWATYMTVTAQIPTDTSGSNITINSYKKVYESFGFDPAKFNDRLARFYLEQTNVSKGGKTYFIPSWEFGKWFEEMRTDYIQQNFMSTIDSQNASELLIIDKILRLLIKIIGILQQVSVAQANNLTFLTNWQSAYTDELSKIPHYLTGDATPLGPKDTSALTKDEKNALNTFRGDANTQMQAITTKVQAWRGAVQDQAKAMQSTINQSQDSSNQQTQMATSLIQQLSTILSQIFR